MFARTGITAAQNVVNAAIATSENSWNPNELIEESLKARSKEKQAAMRAEAEVKSAEQRIRGDKAIVKRDLAIDKASKDLRRGQRKAGLVAAAGKTAGLALMKTPDPKKPYQSDLTPWKDYLDKKIKQLEELQVKQGELQERGPEYMETPQIGQTETPQIGQPVTTPGSASKDVSTASSANPQGAMSKQQIRQLALNTGFTPQQANIVVGIAGGESGYDPSNSTKRSGLYARTGEDSVGLMQINWGFHKDKGWLQGLGINSREDLLDPVKNMRAAKYLHDGSGGFGDWTVYDKGIYQDFL